MARLPALKRILPEQFPDLKWMQEFLGLLNPFIEEVNRALNRQLTVSENMAGAMRVVRIDHTYPVKFRWELASPPRAAWIVYARPVDGSHIAFTEAPYLDWEIGADGSFQINEVVGLPSTAVPWNIRIIALAG